MLLGGQGDLADDHRRRAAGAHRRVVAARRRVPKRAVAFLRFSCCGAPSPICCQMGVGERNDIPRAIPTSDRSEPLDAGVVRAGVLAMLALIVGSMFTYELVRSTSPSTPLPRPSASGAAPALAANPVGQLPSKSASAPRKTRG
jgi:hypothetical protein